MGRKQRNSGFALILVLIVVAVAATLSATYICSASLRVSASSNFESLSRARYLAESGLEHAIHLLRSDPSQLDGTAISPLGPFFVDGGNNSYSLSAEPVAGQAGQYLLTATGSVGGMRRSSSVTVRYMINISTAITVGSGAVSLPGSLTINGDIHCNGSLTNEAVITGDVTSTDGVSDPFGRISGEIDGSADPVTPPSITYDQYLSYRYGGTDCQALEYTDVDVMPGHPLCNGAAITPGNLAGVVYLNPSEGNTIAIHGAPNLLGTLVIDGDIILSGPGITITPVDGFPAIVATGCIWITDEAKDTIINGVVFAAQGFAPLGTNVEKSNTTINGAVVSAAGGFDASLPGIHTVNLDPEATSLYDYSSFGGGGGGTVTVLEWND